MTDGFATDHSDVDPAHYMYSRFAESVLQTVYACMKKTLVCRLSRMAHILRA